MKKYTIPLFYGTFINTVKKQEYIKAPIKKKIIETNVHKEETIESTIKYFNSDSTNNIIIHNITKKHNLYQSNFEIIDFSKDDLFIKLRQDIKNDMDAYKDKNVTMPEFLGIITKNYIKIIIKIFINNLFIDKLNNRNKFNIFRNKKIVNIKYNVYLQANPIHLRSGKNTNTSIIHYSTPHIDVNDTNYDDDIVHILDATINNELNVDMMKTFNKEHIQKELSNPNSKKKKYIFINLWILLECTNDILKNKNLAFLLNKTVENEDIEEKNIKHESHNKFKDNWYSKFNIKPGQGYMWNSMTTPHYSFINPPYKDDIKRTSMEVRFIMEVLE